MGGRWLDGYMDGKENMETRALHCRVCDTNTKVSTPFFSVSLSEKAAKFTLYTQSTLSFWKAEKKNYILGQDSVFALETGFPGGPVYK